MQQTIARITKSWTNTTRWPVAWLELACGHTARLRLRDECASAHDEANHLEKVGDTVACERCDWYASKLEQLRKLDPGVITHSRFRTRDSRGRGDGDYYVYVRDARSPTGCKLLLSIDATPEAAELLRKLAASPLSPTEPR